MANFCLCLGASGCEGEKVRFMAWSNYRFMVIDQATIRIFLTNPIRHW